MLRAAPLLFILIPLIELYFIIVVGEMIGAFWTVMLVIITAVVGVNLLRVQGMSTLSRAQRNMAQGQIPAMEMMEGVALAVAGVLLITPGFITDTLGFLLLLPPTRQAMIRFMMSRAVVHGGFNSASTTFYQHGGHHRGPADFQGKTKPYSDSSNAKGRTIEGEYTREDK
jgi:UPF0716 protein FxsA